MRCCGREAEGGGLLNRYTVEKPYRGFESLRHRHPALRDGHFATSNRRDGGAGSVDAPLFDRIGDSQFGARTKCAIRGVAEDEEHALSMFRAIPPAPPLK